MLRYHFQMVVPPGERLNEALENHRLATIMDEADRAMYTEKQNKKHERILRSA